MAIKQHVTKHPMDQRRNQTRNKKNYLEMNGNTTLQILWDAAKALLRGKFIAMQAYLKKQENSQINNLTLHLIEKEEQSKPKVSIKKEIIKSEWK